jgi:uncharacterized membrane protein HdeD (DUF308 family)
MLAGGSTTRGGIPLSTIDASGRPTVTADATRVPSGIALLAIAALTAGAIIWRAGDLVGALTVAAGLVQCISGAWHRTEVDAVSMASGVLYIVIGGLVVTHVAESRLTLALLAAVFLTAQGVIRIVVTDDGGRSTLTVVHAVVALGLGLITATWALLQVIVSVMLEVVTWRVWPLPSLRGIGLFIVLDMVLCSVSLMQRRHL